MKTDHGSGENSFRGAFDIVALAASAGGLKAISEILAVLPSDFLAAIVVVQHLDPRHRSLMADILSRRTALKVREAQEGAQLNPGTAYIAPANRHLLVNLDGTLSLSQSELVHLCAPRLISCLNPSRRAIRSAPLPWFCPAPEATVPWASRRSRKWAEL